MSEMANTTPLVTTVTNPATNPREMDTTPRVNIQEFCEEYYEDILPIIMDKVHQDRRKDVHTRLDFGEGPRERAREDSHRSSARAETTKPERARVQDRLRYDNRHEADSRDTLRGRNSTHGLNTSREDRLKDREHFRSIRESYDDSISHSRRRKRGDTKSPSSSASRSDSSDGKYQRSKSKRHKSTDKDDLARPRMSQVERWAMPTWCHMFNSTLIGEARVWFDELPPESIDSYKDLKAAFLAYFMQQKKYVKDPVEIHNIKQREGETIVDFMERFKVETGRMKGALECMQISGFMHGVNNPELTKHLNEHVPKTMEEMMITTIAFIRGEVAAASKKKGHVSWKAHDQSKRQNSDKRFDFRGHSREGRGSNRFTPPHKEAERNPSGRSNTDECMQLKKRIEELVRAGKLSHLIKEIKQGWDQSKTGKKETTVKDKPAEIYMVQSWQRTVKQKSQTVPATTSLTGFSGETIWPLGQLRLLVIIGDSTHSTRAWMDFMIVKSLSPYNGIIGRLGLRAIQAVLSTVHGMLKFPVEGGIVTIRSTMLIPTECASVITSPTVPSEERTCPANFKVALHPDFPDQEVAIRGTLSDKGRTELCSILKKNLEIFAWKPSDMTGALERAKVIQAEVQKLVEVGIMREVYYHDWLSNPLMVKKHDGSWRMCVDFTDLNKACPQDCYPLPEIDWKVESLCGYPFKCFLDAYKGYHQIQLAEPDEEKTAIHTGQGVYCYTKIPFGLKNASATYQRLMDKAFEGQIGRNIEVYVDDLMVKSYIEAEMIRDIEETFRTLRKVNMKLNPKKCSFGLAEGVFLGPRTSVKGQILADFLIKMPGEDSQAVPAAVTQEEPWTLFTDGSSCGWFTASNNEAEYEALIAGLRIAARMGVKDVHVRVDSKLVANQVLGTYVAKEDNMVKHPKQNRVNQLRALIQTGTSRSAQGQIHKGEGSGNGDRGRRTDLDDTVSGLLKKRNPPRRQEGGKKAPPQGQTIRVTGGGPLQTVVPYAVVKIRRTAPGGSNGLMERANRSLREGIKSRLGEGNKNWIEELPHVLWAHRTMIKSSHRDTPFSLTYGTEAVIPTEIGMPTYRTAAVDVVSNDAELRLNLDLLEECHERAAICEAKAKSKMTKYYNARVRGVTFKPGDFVYRSNDASHAVAGGKLGPKWEGPYEVTEALGNGAYKL
uniref:Reverse transcriptase domain-containing protein n=1 Tax=Tanacetum cinerariifolium TaxID=118510 RepID=A0A699HII1_TANCI|nr:reverse transcriptase domain-containing protein [Tanacetum cinerariifolium]